MMGKLLDERLDMVVATRVDREEAAYRAGHRAGNRMLTGFVAHVFGRSFTDILSGYRVFSRRFVKSFPVLSGGFEIETELTVHALELELPVGEVATPYYSRPLGSASKLIDLARRLSHPPDGAASSIAPNGRCRCSARIGIALAIVSIGLAIPIFITYLQDGLVPRLPTAVLVDRPDAARIPVDCLRPHPRHRDARPARDEASRLSGAARAGRRAAAELNVRELVRTNDAVLITAIEALLKARSIPHMVVDQQHERAGRLDRHFAAPYPGRRGSSSMRRGGLLEEAGLARRAAARCGAEARDVTRRRRARRPARSAPAARAIASATTPSCLRRRPPPRRRAGGRTRRRRRCRGACARAARDWSRVTLVEIDPELAALARENAARNGLPNACARSASMSPRRRELSPPLASSAGRGRPCADESAVQRRAQSVARSAAAGWRMRDARDAAAHGSRPPRGLLRPGRHADADLAGRRARCGAHCTRPTLSAALACSADPSKPAAPAIRVLVRAAKQSRAPLALLPGLVLTTRWPADAEPRKRSCARAQCSRWLSLAIRSVLQGDQRKENVGGGGAATRSDARGDRFARTGAGGSGCACLGRPAQREVGNANDDADQHKQHVNFHSPFHPHGHCGKQEAVRLTIDYLSVSEPHPMWEL